MMKKYLLPIVIIAFLVGAYFVSRAAVNNYDNPANSDFFTFWLAGRLVLRGSNPYSVLDWVGGHNIFGSTWFPNLAFIYPLPLAIFLLPIGLFNQKDAFILWDIFSIFVTFLSIYFLMQALGDKKRKFLIPIIAGTIIFRPLFPLVGGGQISGWLLFMIVISLILWDIKQWLAGGMVLTLTLLKPNIGIFLIFFVSSYLLLNKNHKAIFGIILGGMSLFILGAVLDPWWLKEYYYILTLKYNQIFGYAPTIWGMAFYITGFVQQNAMPIGFILSGILIVGYFILIIQYKTMELLDVMSFSILISLLVTPSIWPYDQILLLVPIMSLLGKLVRLQVHPAVSSLAFPIISTFSIYLYVRSSLVELENLNVFLTIFVLAILTFTFILSVKINRQKDVFDDPRYL